MVMIRPLIHGKKSVTDEDVRIISYTSSSLGNPRITMLKFLLYLPSIILLSSVFLDLTYSLETRTGRIRRNLEHVCRDQCDDFYLEPDTGYGLVNLYGDLAAYVGPHVQVTGFRAGCGGCIVFIVVEVSLLTGVENNHADDGIPRSVQLHQNVPNPFNPATRITYDLPMEGVVSLAIFDIRGEEVMNLVSGRQSAGKYSVMWNAEERPSGVYIYRLLVHELNGNTFGAIRKMLFVR